MTYDIFNKLLDELDGNSLETLKQKNAKYASYKDCLHNFESGAEIMGGTPAQCAWGYMTKHLVALRDKVDKDDFTDRDDLLEKCQDIINYIRFIWVLGNDSTNNKTSSKECSNVNKTYRVTNVSYQNMRIEAFTNGKNDINIIVNFYDVDGASAVLEASGYRLTKREY